MDSDFPNFVTDDEAEYGFCKLKVEALGGTAIHSEPALVCGRILSSSDLLVKTSASESETMYQVKRWGYSKRDGNPKWPEWNIISQRIGWNEIPSFIQESNFTDPNFLDREIVGIEFKYQKITS